MKRAALVVMCLALLVPAASAALTAAQKMAVESFIKQFSAPEFDARQKAVDALVAMGPDVIPLVKKALADTVDNEVKLRCNMVLKALGGQAPAPAPADKFGYGPSKITLEAKDMPLAEVVEKLAEQSGNTRLGVADDLKDKTVTLSLKDVTYWEAVEAVCAKLNLLCIIDYRRMAAQGEDSGWFQLVEAGKDAKLNGFSGPVVVRLDTCVKTLAYRQAKTAGMAYGSQGGLNFAVSYAYEDRIEPLMSEAEVKSALAPDGKNFLTADAPPMRGRWGGMNAVNGKQVVPPFSSFMLMVPDVPDDLAKLSEISGIVRLEFGSGEKEVTIDDVVNAVGKELKFDDWTIKVVKVDKNKWGLQVQVEATYKGQPVDLPAYMTAGSYGWWVKGGEDGKKVRGFNYGIGRAAWGGPGGPRAGNMVVIGGQPPAKGQQSITFQGNFEAGTYSLTLLLPTVHETKEYPFTIKNVPLP